MIKTYWKRGDKSEEMDTSSFNGQEKKISAFIHHGNDPRTIGETAALDACVHAHFRDVCTSRLCRFIFQTHLFLPTYVTDS